MAQDKATDTGYAPQRWAFDDEVTRVFDDMLWRSIPGYAEMRSLCHQVAMRHVADGTCVVDLGCSRGGALAKMVEERPPGSTTFLGAEVSGPMVEAARLRFEGNADVKIARVDLRDGFNEVGPGQASVVLAVLTLQFIPIERRQRVVRDAYAALRSGGAMILVEKFLGSTSETQALLVDAYHGFKRSNGYTQEDVDRKALALEGVLVPQTRAANEEMLRREGFRAVEPFWQYLNFAAWVAIK